MRLDEMLQHAPVYVFKRDGRFHANWFPKIPTADTVFGRGIGDSPYDAVARAYADARNKGWVQP